MRHPGEGSAAAAPAGGYHALAAAVAAALEARAVRVLLDGEVVAGVVGVNAGDAARSPELLAEVDSAGARAVAIGTFFETTAHAADGHRILAVPFGAPPGPCGAVGIVMAPHMAGSKAELRLVQELAAAAAREDAAHTRARSLEAVIESQHESIQVVAADGTILNMNPAGLRTLGVADLHDATGADFTGFLAPEYRPVWQAAQARVLAGGEEAVELRLASGTGERRRVAMYMVPFRGPCGAVVASLSVMADVEERRIADDALVRYLSTLRGTLEATTDGILVTDANGRITAHNRRFCRLLDLAEDGIGADGLDEIWEHIESLAAEPARFRAAIDTISAEPHTPLSELIELYDRRVIEIVSQPHGLGGVIAGRVWSLRDLTERVLAERALRSSEERFRSIVENTVDIVFASDVEGRIGYISPSVERVLGYAPRSLLGRVCFDFVHPDDHAAAVEAQLAAFAGTGQSEATLRARAHDGSYRWLHLLARTTTGEDGAPLLVSTARDVTDLEIAQRDLHASNETLRTILSAMPLAVVGLDHDGIVRMWNRTAERMFGWTADEVLGRPYMLCPPDQREEHLAVLRASLDGRPLDGVELVRVRKDGTAVHVAMWTSVGNGGEGSGTVIGLLADVSDRRRVEERLRRNEERFRALIENALDITAMLELDGTIRFGSPSGERLLGYERNELKGRSILELIHPDDLPMIRRLMAAAHLNGHEARMIDVRLRHRDGSWRVLEGLAKVLVDDDARNAGLVVNARDITERKELEAQLRQAQKMEAIGQFAGGVAHDFNNMLTAIKGFALLMQGSSDDDERDAYVDEIRKAADRAAALTRQLLAFSRQQILQPQVVNMNDVVSDMAGMLRRLLGADIDLRCLLDPGLRPILADPTQIEQVIMNLAVNARDAMPHGGVLEVRTANRDRGCTGSRGVAVGAAPVDDRDYVVLSVSDDGCGMDDATRSRMFDPFFTTKAAGKGTGLGLSTVYGIITQSGGYIEVHSAVGGGTRFDICLPAADERQQPRPYAGPARPNAAASGTVLVVDDEPGVRFVARRILERAGYTVIEAADGDEAIAAAMAPDVVIDLLLTDVTMPGMSGPQLASRLALSRPDLRVVLMSGYTDLRPGPDDLGGLFFVCLAKPFDPAELRHVVAAALGPQACGSPAATGTGSHHDRCVD